MLKWNDAAEKWQVTFLFNLKLCILFSQNFLIAAFSKAGKWNGPIESCICMKQVLSHDSNCFEMAFKIDWNANRNIIDTEFVQLNR